MKSVRKIYDIILPKGIDKSNPVKYHKAIILSATLLIVFILNIVLCLVDLLSDAYQADYPYLVSIILTLSLIIAHKKNGRTTFVGNLTCIIFFIIFIYNASIDNQIFSDSLFWIISIPIYAFLVTSKRYGWSWMILSMLSYSYFWLFGENINHNIDPLYYYVSLISLVFLVSILSYAYKVLQDNMYKDIQNRNAEISKQKEVATLQNQELKRISQKLKKSNLELQNFAHTTAHDLKQPLRSISNFAQLLKLNENSLAEDQKEYTEYIVKNSKYLSNLIDSILNYSSINQTLNEDSISYTKVNLQEVYANVCTNLMALINENEAEIILHSDLPFINANQLMMDQVFQNLISNAIKYRKESVSPKVILSFTSNHTHYLFSIKDNGMGIPPEKLEDVFLNFHTLNPSKKGYGIGLSICKKIIEKHDGEIYVDSDGKNGSTFHFSIKK